MLVSCVDLGSAQVRACDDGAWCWNVGIPYKRASALSSYALTYVALNYIVYSTLLYSTLLYSTLVYSTLL